MTSDSQTAILQPSLLDRLMSRRAVSNALLRECVLRDLRWLLNTVNLASSVDLERYPRAARSVLNFGMPSFAGTLRAARDDTELAEHIRICIEAFEPRLSGISVSRISAADENDSFALEFRIEGELWGDPIPQHLMLRTRIDRATGEVALAEPGGVL